MIEFFLYDESTSFNSLVYRNLHKNCWSVKALSGPNRGRTVLHASFVAVEGADFYVSQKGRERVLREQKKNVHAGVFGRVSYAVVEKERYATCPRARHVYGDGTLAHMSDVATHPAYREATYNPYKFSGFVFRDDLSVARLGEHDSVILTQNGKVYVENIETLIDVVKQKRLA